MANLDHNVIKPLYDDKYYVYALCKPCGQVFYIGKGKGARINNHFAKWSLDKSNGRKNQTIRKYGNTIKREILCYFDSEDTAYEYEEWLISHYGLESEGGQLRQYAKTRNDYSTEFKKDVSGIASKSRKRKYSEELVIQAYKMFFEQCLPTYEVSEKLGITYSYVSQLMCGHKDKILFSKYVTSGEIKNLRVGKVIRKKKVTSNRIAFISDDELIVEYDKWFDNKESLSSIASRLEISKIHLRDIFYGNSRPHLFHGKELPQKVKNLSDDDLKTIIYEFVINKKSNLELSSMFDVNERRIREIKSCSDSYKHLQAYKETLMEK
ncbi:MAG: GIY-YIG nuclease family protein [Bacilli bacterium]